MSKNNGGPAFPVTLQNTGNSEITGLVGERMEPRSTSVYPGISLRDYFAASATRDDLQAMRYLHIDNHARSGGSPEDLPPMSLAQAKYAYADEMLREREK